MNTLRTNFVLPNSHKILITPYWLLWFIEGDGSFSVSTLNSFPLRFNITPVITEKKCTLLRSCVAEGKLLNYFY